MAVSTFGPWDASIHLQPDQIKRRERAQRADVTPDSVDPVSQSCVIRGSGAAPYQVTLSSCTCSDFVKRNLPCKHIYRLAAELKLIGLPLKHGANKADQLSIEEAVSAIEALSVPAQKYIQRFFGSLSYSSDVTFTCEVTPITEELKTCPLFTYKDTPLSSILGTFTKAQLLDVCAQISVPLTLKKNAAKAALSGWILDHADLCSYEFPRRIDFSFLPQFVGCARSTYSYLLRKFRYDSLFDPEGEFVYMPHGSVLREDGLYYFPDDKITALLTYYGCNRCLNGFKAQYDIPPDEENDVSER